MDKLFLDANVLFSAAYKAQSGIIKLWHLPKVQLITSGYALEEANRNLTKPTQLSRLASLIQPIKLITKYDMHLIPLNIQLNEKDRPILAAAITARANFLITGDFRDFGRFYGKMIKNVLILPPSLYLSDYCKSNR